MHACEFEQTDIWKSKQAIREMRSSDIKMDVNSEVSSYLKDFGIILIKCILKILCGCVCMCTYVS